MYRLRQPSADDLAALGAAQSDLPLSYGTTDLLVGTPTDSAPSDRAGYNTLFVERSIGRGPTPVRSGQSGHRVLGRAPECRAILQPSRAALAEGNVVALALRIWPLWVTAACRIVEVIDDTTETEHRFGFVYGTLPHHPASGEERFLVTRNSRTDEVRLQIVALSRQTSLLSRLSGPIGPLIQRSTAKRYLDGFEDHGR